MNIIYVCMMCGKYSAERDGLRDVSCFMHAREIDTDKAWISYNEDHTRVIGINVVGGPGDE